MDEDHYWANWANACPYTIDSVYVLVRFSNRSRNQLGNGVWALHFVVPGTHQVMRLTAPRAVPDFDFVQVRKITTDSLEALLAEPEDRRPVPPEAERTGDPGPRWHVTPNRARRPRFRLRAWSQMRGWSQMPGWSQTKARRRGPRRRRRRAPNRYRPRNTIDADAN
jgi:hypothetical protein